MYPLILSVVLFSKTPLCVSFNMHTHKSTHICRLRSDKYIWVIQHKLKSGCHLSLTVRSSTRCQSPKTRFTLWTRRKLSTDVKILCSRYREVNTSKKNFTSLIKKRFYLKFKSNMSENLYKGWAGTWAYYWKLCIFAVVLSSPVFNLS